jgi:hypothetical protein
LQLLTTSKQLFFVKMTGIATLQPTEVYLRRTQCLYFTYGIPRYQNSCIVVLVDDWTRFESEQTSRSFGFKIHTVEITFCLTH